MQDPLQSALEAVGLEVPASSEYSKLLIASKCRALLCGYHARWADAGYEIEGVEHLVESDLWNPETQRKSRSFSIAGKLDATLLLDGRRIVMDHKTTSEDISDPNSPYWRQLAIEGQASHYMLLEWLNGRKADSAVWDVVRKPGISPKKLSKTEIEMVVIGKTYSRQRVSDDSIAELQSTGRETLEMYEFRLAQDCISERPQWYFQRRPVPRLDSSLLEYAADLWDNSQEILHARRTERHARNSGACMLYHSPCKFLGICSGSDEPSSENWQKKAQVHVELSELTGDGRDVLTNSRIRMFQTCRRKHFLTYELGIERLDEEEREALFFGQVFHAGLAAWLNSQRTERTTNVNNSSVSAGNEFATAATNPASDSETFAF